MGFDGLLVTEIFHSLQGEGTQAGLPFAFIRLTGCNLRCAYCDSTYAFKGGMRMKISEVIEEIEPFQVQYVLITGGEPLLQRQIPTLVQALNEAGYQVSIETHGEIPLTPLSSTVKIIMDIKTPSSGMCRGGFRENFPFLKLSDEIKFVIASESDYSWARKIIAEPEFPKCEVLFSPALRSLEQPASFSGVHPTWLAEQILKDRLRVRFQLQLHKTLWGADRRGV